MMKRKILAASLFAVLSLLPLGAFAQTATIPIDVEVGYRWTDVSGNEDLYRTQINEQEGFLIRSLTMFSNQPQGMLDHFRLDISELGTAPAGGVRIEAGKSELFNVRLSYRSLDSFSALPAFANPLLDQGVIPGQHTWDRTRTMFDADIEFLPGGRFTPFIGYSMNGYGGPGTSTYSLGGDEFHLRQDLEETDNEFRVGLAFNTTRINGVITQGWRTLDGEETLTLMPGANGGNNLNAILGRPVTAADLTRTAEHESESPFTNLYVTGTITPRLRAIVDFSQFSAETDASESESANGSFVSFAISRFFGGLDETVTSNAQNDTWRGGARAEFAITDRMDFTAGYRTDSRDLTGTSLINTIYADTLNFGGVDPRDINEIIHTDNGVEREQSTVEAAFSARAIGPFSFRLGFGQTQQDLTVSPDLHEIVVPGNQGGEFERSISTIDASANFSRAGFTVGAALRMDDSDDAIMRTDFLNRDRIRARASYRTPGNFLRVGVTAEQTELENDGAGIGYDAEMQHLVADIEVAPWTPLRLRASYSQLDSESRMNIIRPESFAVVPSIHSEEGEAIEAGLTLSIKRFMLDADVAQFENDGSIPFSFDRYRGRLMFDIVANTGVLAEYTKDRYEEVPAYGQYDADRIGLFLRWHR